MTTPFAPQKNGQYSPSTSTSAKDCVAAVTAMLIERATVGALRVSHAKIRSLSGAPATRGLYLYEAAAAAKKLGVSLEAVLWVSRNTFRDTVSTGSACGVTIHTSETRYTSRRTNYYVGLHEVFATDYSDWPAGEVCACELHTATAHGEFTVEDPGTTSVGYLQWSAGLVYRAAEKVTGGNGVNLLVAPDTEGPTWIGVGVHDIRSLPTYAKGKKLGSTVDGREYKGGRTENGGQWKRADGTFADGWIHIDAGAKGWGWTTRLELA